MPAVRTSAGAAPLPATPTMMAAVDTIPSLAPSTAARSHPPRCERCGSGWGCAYDAHQGRALDLTASTSACHQ